MSAVCVERVAAKLYAVYVLNRDGVRDRSSISVFEDTRRRALKAAKRLSSERGGIKIVEI